ncbi:Histidine decarboxylase [hydrothermal vent metagenome]|uniref:Histidine decarboxylase n=1 Tax=hydrothermal vent metagenome TaxID=652676 RepID=A0A3B0YQ70_9ZZZZ
MSQNRPSDFPSSDASKNPLSQDTEQRLDELFEYIKIESQNFLGYPCNQSFDYSALDRFVSYALNNIGDPFLPSTFKLNTHTIECEVIEQFARYSRADPKDIWGYVNNGGTEGNMYGFYLARELYPEGMVYYSEDTHYSVSKILRLLKSKSIMIKSQENGEVDYDDLRETIRIHRDSPPIIFANIGTTMKGAVDNLDTIKKILHELALPGHYIHADAALSGMILPFVDDPVPFGFDAGIDSISISGHKMIGAPFPCGVVLAREKNVKRIARSVEYIGTLDTTLSGSRNGLSPLFLWYALRQHGEKGFKRIIQSCFEIADYAIAELDQLDLHPWRNKNSNSVVFDRPTEEIVHQWQLAVQGTLAHIITMPHVGKDHINRLVIDLKKSMSKS